MTITRTGIEIRRIGGRVGAEIPGLDLFADLDAETVAQINSALLPHKSLIFRGQHLGDACCTA